MSKAGPHLPVSTSVPPAFTPAEQECYRTVLEALTSASIPYVVAGAFALHQHTGIWRTTKDLDLMLEAASIPATFQALEAHGYKTHVEDPVWLAKAFRGDFFVDLITANGNAMLPVQRSWIDRAIPCEVLGVPCRVLAAEEMIASKVFVCRRERYDGADIAHLLNSCAAHLDWDRLFHLLDGHTLVLLSNLVLFAYIYPGTATAVPRAVWDRLLNHLNHSIYYPDPAAPFRGSLIDPKMFAIDVAEWGHRDLYLEHRALRPPLTPTHSPTGESE